MKLLAVESSCDETSVAVVEMDDTETHRTCRILSNQIASQIPLHRVYGGVVPEIAGRAHAEAVSSLAYDALKEADVTLQDVDAVAVTAYPGLIGALLVGVNFAKGLAFSNDLPLIAVDHIKGHIAANYFVHPDLKPPFLALVASGGHTSVIRIEDYTHFVTVGSTRDDAIGEAFDKVARVMGIAYPGGKEMDRLAYLGNEDAISLPLAAIHDDSLDFSFSGLKTAVLNTVNRARQRGETLSPQDVAASFTKSVKKSVTQKVALALERYGEKQFVLAGGVAANSHLQQALQTLCEEKNVAFYSPPLSLCGDNAAMIGAQGYYEYLSGARAAWSLNARANG